MAVTSYTLSLLSLDDHRRVWTPDEMMHLLRVWRKHHSFASRCAQCGQTLVFDAFPFTVCCQQFYYDSKVANYPVTSLAIATPGFPFHLPVLKKYLRPSSPSQEFLMIPDPIYWQVASSLVYEKIMKFVKSTPISTRSKEIQPASKVDVFFKQMVEAPLNYSSIHQRSGGKKTFLRQVAMGKRTMLSMRAMIVPDPSLPPNAVHLPEWTVDQFQLHGQWVILNRMPSLQPGNFVALRVRSWPHSCFGIPLEVVQSMHADFDGDECNLYMVPSLQSQSECATLLNTESQLGCFVMNGPKLQPSQDMKVAYFGRKVDFLPVQLPDLCDTFQVLYDLYGSKATFDYMDRMRLFYLDVHQNDLCFALTLEEMLQLREWGRGSFEAFVERAQQSRGCLVVQVLSGAKGSFEHLYQMFGKSFWDGLSVGEAVEHAESSMEALSQTSRIWEPGYGYSKLVYNLQALQVDYLGQLVDGTRVIERDVLDALDYTDVLSEATFRHLVKTEMEKV